MHGLHHKFHMTLLNKDTGWFVLDVGRTVTRNEYEQKEKTYT